MCEILFRGKRKDNGEWVYGSIISFDDNRKAIMPSRAKVFKEQGTTTICCNECYDVDSTTVGQFTGLCDKNGTKIFEGDVIEYEEQNGIVCYSVVYNEKSACFAVAGYKGMIIGDFTFFVSRKCRVTSNIYDNPEFVGGKNKND